jgi:hypothetical protein
MDHKKFTGKMAKALAEFKFRRSGNMFMEPSDYYEIPLCKILYFVRGMGLLAEESRWRGTIDQKMVVVRESPVRPPHSY